jgi:hypothetical protein
MSSETTPKLELELELELERDASSILEIDARARVSEKCRRRDAMIRLFTDDESKAQPNGAILSLHNSNETFWYDERSGVKQLKRVTISAAPGTYNQ